MAAINGIDITSLLFDEGSAPSTPASTKWKLYFKTDGLYFIDDAGTETGPLGTGGGGVQAAHGAQVQRASTNFSVGNNTFTAVEWDAEVFDTDSMHDNVTNPTRITIPSISGVTTGLWRLAAHGYSNATTGRTDVMFRKNAAGSNSGGTFINTLLSPVADAVSPFLFVTDAVLSATDYVECFVRTTGGSFVVAYDAGSVPTFEAIFLGKVT